MPLTDRTQAPPDQRRQTRRADRVRGLWSGVRIDYVEIVPWGGGQRARVVVDPAGLPSAELPVALLPARRADIARAGIAERPLTCRRRYASGCLLFEAVVPPDEPAVVGEWLVRVRPAVGPVAPPVLHRLRVATPAVHGR